MLHGNHSDSTVYALYKSRSQQIHCQFLARVLSSWYLHHKNYLVYYLLLPYDIIMSILFVCVATDTPRQQPQ